MLRMSESIGTADNWNQEVVKVITLGTGVCVLRILPNFGELFGAGEGPTFVTDQGVEVWLYRQGESVRFYDRSGNQVGPEHRNLYPASVWLFAQGWHKPTSPQWLNAG
jgi:hypothetical protein